MHMEWSQPKVGSIVVHARSCGLPRPGWFGSRDARSLFDEIDVLAG